MFDIWYLVFGIRYLVFGIWYSEYLILCRGASHTKANNFTQFYGRWKRLQPPPELRQPKYQTSNIKYQALHLLHHLNPQEFMQPMLDHPGRYMAEHEARGPLVSFGREYRTVRIERAELLGQFEEIGG